MDIDVCIPKSVLRACERGVIGTVDKKRGPKKSRYEYASTKGKIKNNNNNNDNTSKAMDFADPDSKASCKTA